MAPIRVGIIGLSAKPLGFAAGTWAATAHLPSFLASPAYELVALCNTSVEAARRSIEFHNLPPSTKAYGDATDLANDPDVDLIVVSVVVTRHLELALPALENKKDVFVEWPLGATTEEAEKLTALAKKNGVRATVGLQGRADVITVKIKEIIDSGEIGEIRSTSVVGAFPQFLTTFWFEGAEYYLDMKSGGNPFTISFGHFLDSFTHILGDFDTDTLSSVLKRDVTTLPVKSADFSRVLNPAHPKSTPDHILLQGQLKSGAVASIAFRGTPYSSSDVHHRWIITGTKGEIELTKGSGQWQFHEPKFTLTVRNGQGEAREVDPGTPALGVVTDVAPFGINSTLIWDAYAKGDLATVADFESSLKTHHLLDAILKKSGYTY